METDTVQPPTYRLLSRAQVLDLVPFSYVTLWEMMRRGEFPRAVLIGKSKLGWHENEIKAWVENRPRQKLKGDRPEPKETNPR